MKKFFHGVGMITLVFCSFWYTDQTAMVVREKDPLMISIKEYKQKESLEVTEAFIEKDQMIPGIHGMEIDIEKSYQKMREIGYFDPDFFVYKEVYPKYLTQHHMDKYIISGNKQKDEVSLLFLINENTNPKQVEQILRILDKKNIHVDFFLDGFFLENNNDIVYQIKEKKHFIGNLSYENDYNHPSFLWLDAVIKRLNNENTGYCLVEKQNKMALNLCSMYKNHTIIPSMVIDENPYSIVKKNILPGNLIALEINHALIEELPVIIDYIHFKGYQISLLQDHLKE